METISRLRARLSDRALAYLDGEVSKDGPFSTLCSVAKSALLAGIEEVEFENLVLASELRHEFEESDGRNRVERHIGRAWSFVEDNDQPYECPLGIRDRLSALHVRLKAHRFTGRGATNDRKVALDIVEWCHSLGAYSPLLSARFIAERCGIGHGTAGRSLNRLTEAGLLRKIGEGKSGASHYRVNLDWLASVADRTVRHTGTSKENPGDLTTCPTLTNFSPEVSHPAFLPAALGPVSGRLFFELPPDVSVTVSEAARLIGVSRSTCERALKRLAENGLFLRIPGYPVRYQYAGGSVDSLDNIARLYGTLDWFERKAEQYERQRTGWAEQQKQWDYARNDAVEKSRASELARKPEPVCYDDPCRNPFCEIHDDGPLASIVRFPELPPKYDPFAS